MRIRGLWFIALVAVAACGGSGDDGTGPTSPNEVALNAASFTPALLTVSAGTTVKWRNATSTQHTITPNNPAQAGAWVSQNISGSGTTFTHTFNTAGTFGYSCLIHAGMTGTIVVQ